MNETINLINQRKSVRAFEEKKISSEDKHTIINSALRAPTAGNMMLYSIIDVTDQSIKDTLAITCDNQPFIAKADLVLVFVADYRRWYDMFFYAKCEDKIRTPEEGDMLLAISDTFIAAQNAVVAAESLGIGSCYIGDIIENCEKHIELLKLPTHVLPVCMLVFGHPTDGQKNRALTTRFDENLVVFENSYRRLNEVELSNYYPIDKTKALYTRKYISDFTMEMNRSAKLLIEYFKKEMQ